MPGFDRTGPLGYGPRSGRGLGPCGRVLYIADHFKIPYCIVINKSDLNTRFRNKIKTFAKRNNIPVLGTIQAKFC